MRIEIDIDDELLKRAMEFGGTEDINELATRALTALVEREAAKRLASLGGSEPGAGAARRRRLRWILLPAAGPEGDHRQVGELGQVHRGE
ncbi:MAG: type II toxin-antitoxin system VapB family antitoxin [Rhizobiaceae bacterium]